MRQRRLRNRVVALSLALFGIAWTIVFAQMAVGHDPVLGSDVSGVARRQAKPDESRQASGSSSTQLAIDPATGQIVLVPQGESDASAAPATASPPPVVTQTS